MSKVIVKKLFGEFPETIGVLSERVHFDVEGIAHVSREVADELSQIPGYEVGEILEGDEADASEATKAVVVSGGTVMVQKLFGIFPESVGVLSERAHFDSEGFAWVSTEAAEVFKGIPHEYIVYVSGTGGAEAVLEDAADLLGGAALPSGNLGETDTIKTEAELAAELEEAKKVEDAAKELELAEAKKVEDAEAVKKAEEAAKLPTAPPAAPPKRTAPNAPKA